MLFLVLFPFFLLSVVEFLADVEVFFFPYFYLDRASN